MSVSLHIEVPEELVEQLRQKYNVPAEAAVLEAIRSAVGSWPIIPPPSDVPGMDESPLDPTVKSQKDLIKFLGTSENFMTPDELLEQRRRHLAR